MFDELYPEAADLALKTKINRPPTAPKAPEFSTWGMFRGLGTGLPAGAAQAMASTGEMLGAFGTTLATTGGSAGGMFQLPTEAEQKQSLEATDKLIKGDELFAGGEVTRSFRNAAEGYKPDPTTTHTAEQVVFNFARVGGKAITAAMTMGNVPGAIVAGAEEGFTQAEELKQQGVDIGTRTKVGAVTAVTNAVGFALPVAGKTWLQTAGLVAVGGPGTFVTQQAATKAILENANYADLAKQYDPTDTLGLAMSVLLPGAFGALAMRGAAKSVKAKGVPPDTAPAPDAAPVPDAPTAPMDYPDADLVDAARVSLVRQHMDAANPMPDNVETAGAHNAAYSQALDQVAAGERVAVADVAPKVEQNLLEWGARETAKNGEFVKADYKLTDSQPIYQMREMSPADLYLPELDSSGKLQPEKRGYLPGYIERAKAGEIPPAITAIEMEDGRIRVVDGHRRAMAAKEAGNTIRVLVSPLIDTPAGKVEATAENIANNPIAGKATDTPNFKAWFGDSKVVDDTGAPMVLYHGTPSPGFDNFDLASAGRNTGNDAADVALHFTDRTQTANYYADIGGPNGAVMPVYVALKNPMQIAETVINRSDIEVAKAAGHDGIISTTDKGREFVAFDPKQIKSAIGNSGKFDPNSASLTDNPIADWGAGLTKALDDMAARVETMRAEVTAMADEIPPQVVENMATKPQPKSDPPVYSDTRGGPDRFHGTGKPIPALSDYYALAGDSRNIYGQGFYTTDAVDISAGYMRKGGKNSTLYKVTESDVKMYDMEAPITPEMEGILKSAMGDSYPEANYESGAPLKNLRDVYDEYRRQSSYEGLSRDDVQEVFDSIRANLEAQGYRGFSHVGGALTGKQAHAVKIFWFPESDVQIKPASIADYVQNKPQAPADTAQAAIKTVAEIPKVSDFMAKQADFVEVVAKPNSDFVQAKSDAGLVGGHVRDGALHITTAEVDPAYRGQGEGIKLYTALVDDALAKGQRVFSDSTVEASAVRMYEALQRRGYEVKRLEGGSLEDGAAYGKGAKEPAFEVVGKTEPKPAPALADTAQAATDLIASRKPASWVIREKETGAVIMETFDQKKVDALNTAKYEAVPILDYLVGINGQMKPPVDPNGFNPATLASEASRLLTGGKSAAQVIGELEVSGSKVSPELQNMLIGVAEFGGRINELADQVSALKAQRGAGTKPFELVAQAVENMRTGTKVEAPKPKTPTEARFADLQARNPDVMDKPMQFDVDENGNAAGPATTAREYLERIQREADQDTADASLIEVAANCFLSGGM